MHQDSTTDAATRGWATSRLTPAGIDVGARNICSCFPSGPHTPLFFYAVPIRRAYKRHPGPFFFFSRGSKEMRNWRDDTDQRVFFSTLLFPDHCILSPRRNPLPAFPSTHTPPEKHDCIKVMRQSSRWAAPLWRTWCTVCLMESPLRVRQCSAWCDK